MDNNLKFVSENGKDLCISCETETKYSHDTSIEYREGYVEGAGQLCDACYSNIFNNVVKGHMEA